MKKLLTLLSAMVILALANPQQSQAQLLGINLQFAGDSSWNTACTVPDTVDLMFWGSAGGYQPGDSIQIDINFGDGTDTSYKVSLIQGAMYFQDYFPHVYTVAGAFQVQYIATGPDGAADTLTDQVLVGNSCGDISGSIYVDANNDCIKDPAELPVRWAVRALYNGSEVAYANANTNGEYYLHVPSGFTYTVELVSNSFTIACPATGSYTVNSLPSAGKDFGISCVSSHDLTSHIIGAGFRPGFSRTLHVSALNSLLTCAAPNATVAVTLDPLLTFDSAGVTPVSVSGQTIMFSAGQLAALSQNQWNTWIAATASLSANIGDSLCVTVTVDPVMNDFNPVDNTITVCLPVRNSFDPNEKSEAHVGMGTGNIAPGTELDYTILFQNLGNDDAINIVVVDELDADLDLSTLRITGTSHDYNLNVTGNTMRFEFDNINLPAASVNEPASHGYITYSISHKANAPLGTEIENKADIYFDFNPAIVTNTVKDILATTTGVKEIAQHSVMIYPNPSSEYFIFQHEGIADRVSVFDLSGKLLLDYRNVRGGERIYLKGLQSGFYQVVMESAGKTYSAKLTVK